MDLQNLAFQSGFYEEMCFSELRKKVWAVDTKTWGPTRKRGHNEPQVVQMPANLLMREDEGGMSSYLQMPSVLVVDRSRKIPGGKVSCSQRCSPGFWKSAYDHLLSRDSQSSPCHFPLARLRKSLKTVSFVSPKVASTLGKEKEIKISDSSSNVLELLPGL